MIFLGVTFKPIKLRIFLHAKIRVRPRPHGGYTDFFFLSLDRSSAFLPDVVHNMPFRNFLGREIREKTFKNRERTNESSNRSK